jgi:N-formylglutamate amidohydrolase
MSERNYEILAPAQWIHPAVFNSPHSGTHIPAAFAAQSRLTIPQLRQSEDCYVDEIFSCCQNLGVPMLRSLVSRSYIDLNREPYELDHRMFQEDLPGHMNIGSARVAAGLGTIPKITGENRDIYRGKINLSDALQRVEQIYRPYHRALTALMNECYNATGFALLIDCHSMPSSAVKQPHHPATDIVLGDRFGAACNAEIASYMASLFAREGLRVTRNKPYAGGFITETHGSPRHNRHALQIEINRALYMDETKQSKTSNFTNLQNAMSRVVKDLLLFLPQDVELNKENIAAE